MNLETLQSSSFHAWPLPSQLSRRTTSVLAFVALMGLTWQHQLFLVLGPRLWISPSGLSAR